LKQDINAYVWGTYLLPWNWEWLVNPFYGTNDRMAEIYDRLMFHGATYADLLRQGLPVVSVDPPISPMASPSLSPNPIST
jgi:NTE family protein